MDNQTVGRTFKRNDDEIYEDGLISCFKEGKKYKAGRTLSESQMRLSNDDEISQRSF